MTTSEILPVAIIGGGPIGLAAAAHLVSRGQAVRVYEARRSVGANLRDWGHVQVFTPWSFCIDAAAQGLLERHGWRTPPAENFPTGEEIVTQYLEPLASTPELASAIETGARVTAISRLGIDKVASRDREHHPFVLSVSVGGTVRRDLARAVIDASGTWATPNPLGAGGLPADGETDFAERIAYGIPDVLGRDRDVYAERSTLVIGAGHSAANALMELDRLSQDSSGTTFVWATRGTDLMRIYGGGRADKLPARGDLGARLKDLVDSGRVTLVTGFAMAALREVEGSLFADDISGERRLGPFDRIIAATGQRPDLALTRELRLDLDPWLESTRELGPLIDPNLHSCGSVPPHGHRELGHPEPGFYTVGIKSYGRAPTFLLLTGYEQVRSVAAAIAGDLEAADAVNLVLPETGVCSTDRRPADRTAPGTQNRTGGCCGVAA